MTEEHEVNSTKIVTYNCYRNKYNRLIEVAFSITHILVLIFPVIQI
jgi:hypothetical protein